MEILPISTFLQTHQELEWIFFRLLLSFAFLLDIAVPSSLMSYLPSSTSNSEIAERNKVDTKRGTVFDTWA
jgi:hypothetical protein